MSADPRHILAASDKEVLDNLDTYRSLIVELDHSLHEINAELLGQNPVPAETISKMKHVLRLSRTLRTDLAPQLFDYCSETMNEKYDQRVLSEEMYSQLSEANAKLHKIRSHPFYRAFALTMHTLRTMRTKPAAESAPSSTLPAAVPAPAAPGKPVIEDPYADVDNRGTPFELFRDWVSIFERGGRRFGSRRPLVHDHVPTINELRDRIDFRGLRVLELGALEGANTKQLLDLGAREVTAIEFNPDFFLKCLVAKNALRMENAHFYYGDLNHLLRGTDLESERYDFILCSGLLYHMENPIETVELIAKFAPVIYVWSRVVSARMPAGNWVTLTDSDGNTYRGRRHEYRGNDSLGGVGGGAVWLTPDSLRAAFENRGFKIEDLGETVTGDEVAKKFIARR